MSPSKEFTAEFTAALQKLDLSLSSEQIEALGRARILVAEDAGPSAKLIAMVIRQLGLAEPVLVTDGEAAMAALDAENGNYDLVVSDWNMPKVTGEELLRFVGQSYPDLPFIMITGHGSDASVKTAMEAGATSYIAKPFTPGIVREHIIGALASAIK